MSKYLVQAYAELVNVDSLCEELRTALEELRTELQNESVKYANCRIDILLSKVGGIEEYTEYAKDHLDDAQVLADEPREYELYPYPDNVADLVAAESALQNIGFNLWGGEK